MAKKLGLMDAIKSQPYSARRCPGWFEKLPESAAKDELRELHAARKRGEIRHSVTALRPIIQESLGITVSSHQLEGWFKRDTPDG